MEQLVLKLLELFIPILKKVLFRAEVIAYDDYVNLGSEAKVKEAGKMRVEGKNYIVKDGDVMHFLFNV